MEDILLFGLGGHAHSVVDSIEEGGKYNIIGFLDTEEKRGNRFKDYSVLDTDDAMKKYYAAGVNHAFITIGFMGHGSLRNRLYGRLKEAGFTIPNIIDRTAVMAGGVQLAEGVFIGKRAVINSNAVIGKMCIVNTGAIVEHDCSIGEFSHIAVGSVLCGGVTVGEQTLIGANATVIQERRIGSHCVIGAGAIIRKDVGDGCVVRNGSVVKNRGGQLQNHE